MGLKDIQIVFDNPLSTYECGQPVTGKVVIYVDEPKKIRGIAIKFKGEAIVSFERTTSSRDSRGNTHTKTAMFTDKQSYFGDKYNLLGGNSDAIILEAGEASYPFETTLPLDLPSSFEGKHGYVRYTVKATIERPWKFVHEARATFTVTSPLDLNLDPRAKEPVKLTQEETFCCFCRPSGSLTLVVMIPHSGFVSGQQIPVTVEVDNISQQRVCDVTCTLRKKVTFHAKSPHQESDHDKETVSTISFGSVGRNDSKTWAQLFEVPLLPPSNLANCSLIDLDYELKVKALVSSVCHSDIDLKIPIVLGTVPLQEFAPPPFPGMFSAPGTQPVPRPFSTPEKPTDPGQQWSHGMPVSPETMSGQCQEGSMRAGGVLDPLLPPPSFAQATGEGGKMHEAGDSEFMQGDQRFTPRYPVYNYANASAPPLE